MTQLSKRDMEMLNLLCQMETQLVADRLGIKVTTIYARLRWLREKKEENQTFMNQLYNFEKKCDKLKKLLTSGDRQ